MQQRLAAAEAREKYLERQCDTYLGERQQIKAAIPAELLKEDLTLAENVAFIVSQLSKENPVNDKDPAVCGLCGLPMPPGEEMFQYHGYSGPCPGPPKIMSVEEINASCDVSGHILLPEGSQCGICGVQTADMVRITRSVWDAIRKQLDDTRDQLVDLRQTHNGILAQIGTGDDPTYDELEQRLAAAEAERDAMRDKMYAADAKAAHAKQQRDSIFRVAKVTKQNADGLRAIIRRCVNELEGWRCALAFRSGQTNAGEDRVNKLIEDCLDAAPYTVTPADVFGTGEPKQ